MALQPISKEVCGARVAVLAVHGILGSPQHFDMLLPYLPAEWSYYSIVLDGHGGTVRDFARSSRKKWEEQVAHEVARVCAKYDRVIIVAHSMGCMLMSNTIVKQGLEQKIAGMLFLGAALYPKCDPPIVRTAFRLLYGNPARDNACIAAARIRCGTTLHKRLWEYLAWIPRFIDLFGLARYTRERMPTYPLPMHVLQSYHDEVVARRAIRPFVKNPHAVAEFLMHSSHFYYAHEDEERICNVFCQIVENVRKNVQNVSCAD